MLPRDGSVSLIPLMAEGRILPYLDIPFQHASPRILRAMKRPGDTQGILTRIRRWREQCPDLAIRSTFIVGFPGETEEDFEELLDFLDQAQLDRVGCFAYSPVDGAAANQLDNPLPDSVREERRARFMAKAEEISMKRLSNRVGKRIQVIIDRIDESGGIGRSIADAPEIDGLVRVLPASKPSKRYRVGDIIRATVISAQGHDLIAET